MSGAGEIDGKPEERDSRARSRALLAAAAEPMPEVPFTTLTSGGVVLVYGRDAAAIEAAHRLEDRLDVTVLLEAPAAVNSLLPCEFPVAQGTIRSARGHLGAFEITVDDFALPRASEGAAVSFEPTRDGALSRCDILLDVSGGGALFPAPDLRDGYLRAHPADSAGLREAVARARELVGTFDKPRYITLTEPLCAHSRSHITGCTRCLDLCPAGAIAPAGDHVAIDPNLCAGCGQCAAACPTGAAGYTVPPADALLRKLRTLLLTYAEAGGSGPVVLVHDGAHGAPLIEALERSGAELPARAGLPARVLPFAVNEIAQTGLETIAAAFAYGASALRLLTRGRARHGLSGLAQTMAWAEPLLAGLGLGGERVALIETDDPEVLEAALRAVPELAPVPRPASYLPMGGDKRAATRLLLRELRRAAASAADVVPLPARAPFGAVTLDAHGCTLCLACVSACPTGALTDNPEQPMLRFTEDACIQCGLCQATCPEKVITLEPRLDFRADAAAPRILKAEQPFCCIRCGKPFGVRSTIERVTAKLAGRHWMFKDAAPRLDLIKMCEDCRVIAITAENFDPHAPPRPAVRTTDDYRSERDPPLPEDGPP